jgi:hypothetical protein
METVSEAARGAAVTPSAEQLRELQRLASGYRVSQAIYVAARLGIPDLVTDGARGSDDLAQAAGAHAPSLDRLLRFLAGVGLFDEVAPGRFALTPLGAGLRAGVPGSLRPMTLMLLDEHYWRPWGHLLRSVQTGETAFDHVHGMGTFDYLGQHAEAAETFNEAMTSNTARFGDAITRAYDFSAVERLVDVGGGHGRLLATVLRAHPAMRGVLFDAPGVAPGAAPVLAAAGVLDRCEIAGGDFFEAVPAGGDAYILRQIIHDWDDDRAARILGNCRSALGDGGKVLVLERALEPDPRDCLPVLHVDMEMLVNVGGLQRTDDGYRALFARAGLRLTEVVPLNDGGQFKVFEGTPA